MDQAAHDAWMGLAQKALKGAPLDTLNTAFPDGFTLGPLHAPMSPVYSGRPVAGPWRVVQRIAHDQPPSKVVAELMNGADALSLVFAGAPDAFGAGLTTATADELDTLLGEVMLDHCPIYLSAGARGAGAAALLSAVVAKRRTLPRELHLGLDPYGAALATGQLVALPIADAVEAAETHDLEGTIALADGRPVAEAGGTPAQELAFALAAFAGHMEDLIDAGIDPGTAARRTAMALSASQDQFTSIAKLRAARRLHAMVVEAFGANTALQLWVTTQRRMLSHTDPTTNLLRLTIAAFSAGVGGADAVTVLPYAPDGRQLASRMGRNIQRLLLEESHLGVIADPAAGSGAVEALTDEIAAAAWAKFQTLSHVGLRQSLMGGTVQSDIAASVDAEAAALSEGERTIVGVTKFPPPNDQAASPILVDAPQPTGAPPPDHSVRALTIAATMGASIADLNQPPASVRSLPPTRLSAAQEDAR